MLKTLSMEQVKMTSPLYEYIERKGRAIDPMLTTGTRIETLCDVSADEKPQQESVSRTTPGIYWALTSVTRSETRTIDTKRSKESE